MLMSTKSTPSFCPATPWSFIALRTASANLVTCWVEAGPAATQQVTKFTNAIIEEMRRHGVAGQKLGVDFVDINMIEIFKEKNITWVDGMSPMMEARAVKSED